MALADPNLWSLRHDPKKNRLFCASQECFGAKGADAIELVRIVEGYSFKAALAKLERRYGALDGVGTRAVPPAKRGDGSRTPADFVRGKYADEWFLVTAVYAYGPDLQNVRFQNAAMVDEGKGRPTKRFAWALNNTAKKIGGIGYPMTYLGTFLGPRRGELLAWQFDDVEWFDYGVHVRHAISKRRAHDGAHKWEWHVGPPKSKKSTRRIAAPESVMKLLADLKVSARSTFLFPGDYSGFIDPDKFDAEIWRPIATAAGLPGTRFHDLRHFFASQLIAQGETAAYVRDQMGHIRRLQETSGEDDVTY